MRNVVENPLNGPLELFITTPRTIPVQVVVTTPSYTQAPVNIKTSVVSGQVVRVSRIAVTVAIYSVFISIDDTCVSLSEHHGSVQFIGRREFECIILSSMM